MSRLTAILIFLSMGLYSCQDYSPKPRAYSRIMYPSKDYKTIQTDCPFTFEIPAYSKLLRHGDKDHPCWYNLNYSAFDATLHLSYVPIKNITDLDSLAEDAYHMVFKPHIQRAEEIIEREISDTTKSLYGMIYDLEGKTATPFNFYITDRKNHFFRGSFYFNNRTKRDSVLPIYSFINESILHSIETFEFK